MVGHAVDALEHSLSDSDPAVVSAAAGTLGEVGAGSENTPVALAAVGAHELADCRKAALHSLGMLGPAAIPVLPAVRGALEDPSLDVRLAAASALWGITGDTVDLAPVLASALRSDDVIAQSMAIEMLRVVGHSVDDDLLVPVLIDLLSSHEHTVPSIRKNAIGVLGCFGPRSKPAVELLIKLAKDGRDPYTSQAAAQALWQIDSAAAQNISPLPSPRGERYYE